MRDNLRDSGNGSQRLQSMRFMPRILIIEDNDALRQMMCHMLVAAGYDVQEAANGRAGVDAYRQQPSDLVITDIVMPDAEGLQTIEALQHADAAVKIIAISGAGSATDYLRTATQFGAHQTLEKPFTHGELLSAVAEVLASGS